jgi:ribonuclease D
VLRGLPRLDYTGILRAVERGRSLPPDQLPESAERDADPPQVNLVTGLMMTALNDVCARAALTPGLVATNADIRQLVRARYQRSDVPEECALTRGWRAEHVLPELLAVLDGKRAVRVGDVRSDAPLEWVDVRPPNGGAG